MTSEQMVTLLVMILGLITAVVTLGKGNFEWDSARLKNKLHLEEKWFRGGRRGHVGAGA